MQSSERAPVRTTLIFLGDVIDRGPGGAALLRGLAAETSPRLIVLRGNHEAALADAYHGDEQAVDFWRAYGGEATLAAFGVPQDIIDGSSPSGLIEAMRERIDRTLIAWIERLPRSWEIGDYYFVHAGIRPGVALGKQRPEDQLWIRDDFLLSPRRHDKVIVHGHTIETGEVETDGNRIGLDTGAHEHGVLSAIGLQHDNKWIIQAKRPLMGNSPTRPAGNGTDAAGLQAFNPVNSRRLEEGNYSEIASLIAAILGQNSEQIRHSRMPGHNDAHLRTVTSVSARWQGRAGKVPLGPAFAIAACAAILAGISLYFGKLPAGPAPSHIAMREQLPLQPPARPRPAAPMDIKITRSGLSARPRAEAFLVQKDEVETVAPLRVGAEPKRPTYVRHRSGAQVAEADIPTDDRAFIDPYAGRVAKPLVGAALQSALIADRIATRELNRKQLDEMTGPSQN
jgi:serine/threonine protein phosphatase 1